MNGKKNHQFERIPIGVLTFIHTMNYGAELQGLALRTAVASLGYSSEMVNYECAAVATRERSQARLPGLSDFLHPRRALKLVVNHRANMKREVECQSFSLSNNVFGRPMGSETEIARTYSKVVVGSDQVWNPSVTGQDKTFFLPSASSSGLKKVAYAASFGDSFSVCEEMEWLSRALKGFDAVSVRERTGAQLVYDLSGLNAPVVLDPTLLLEPASWDEWSKPLPEGVEAEKKGGFIFVYLVAEHEKSLAYARRLAKKRGLNVLVIDAFGLPQKGITLVNHASPSQFIWLIKHASCVVTSSFHGVCFSINYKKEFYYSVRDDIDRTQSRLLDLGSRLGFLENEITPGSAVQAPDSTTISTHLENERAVSWNFLKRALVDSETDRK